MNLSVIGPIIALMVLLRLMRAGTLLWIATFWIGMYVTVNYGFNTPIPQSAAHIYMAISTLALAAYTTSSSERMKGVVDPLVAFAGENRYILPLVVVVVAIPVLVAWGVYRGLQEPI